MSSQRAWAGLLLAAGTVVISACGEVVAQPIEEEPSDGGLASDAPTDHANTDALSGDGTVPIDAPAAFCQGHGPVTLPGTDLCAGDLANLFRFAACACTSFDVSGVLTTDALDAGATQVASVAANQALSANSTTTIGGSVWAGGVGLAQGAPAVLLSGTGPGLVSHDIQSGGPVEIGGPYTVMGDVWANGSVTVDATGSLNVDGTVHVSPGDTATEVTSSGGVAMTTVNVPPPCDCTNPIGIAGIVTAYASPTLNDNASIALKTTALDNPSAPVTLPCGLFYVDGIHGGAVTIDVTSRVALFVDGDLSVDQGIVIKLEPGAELDLFVAGNVNVGGPSGSVQIGDVGQPAQTRMYIAGSGNDAGGGVTFSADATISANIYAPNAVVQLASDFVLRGALFAQALQFSGNFAIHYDTSVLQVSQTSGCLPPSGSCSTCNDCPGATPACKGGKCVACVTTSDCCAPLQCNAGTGLCELPTQ